MKQINRSFLVPVVLLFFSSCSDDATAPQPGELYVTSTPSGALIYLDGSDTGLKTTATIKDVAAGEHTLTLKLQGHADWFRRFTLGSLESKSVFASLVQYTGSIELISEPPGASIVVDGVDIEQFTPFTIDSIGVGEHRFRFERNAYLPWERVFNIQRDGQHKITVYLGPGWPVYVTAEQNFGARSVPYVSYDAGDTWQELGRNQIAGSATAIAVDPNNSQTLYVGVQGTAPNLYRSTDAGETWETLNLPVYRPYVSDIEVAAGNSSIIYVTANGFDFGGVTYADAGGIYRSVNGQSFNSAAGGSLPPYPSSTFFMGFHDLAVHPLDPNRAVVGTEAGSRGWAISYTTNGGFWTESQMNPTIDTFFDAFAICFDPVDVDAVYAATSRGLYRSVDAGATFTPVVDTPCRAIAVDPSDHFRLYMGADGAVWTSPDAGSTWEEILGYPGSQQVGNIAVDARDPIRVFVASGTLYPFDGVSRYLVDISWKKVLNWSIIDMAMSSSRLEN